MKANELLGFLLFLNEGGHDLTKIDVNFRESFDADVMGVSIVEEDLYNDEGKLTSILLVSDPSDV